jgi:DNA-binding transcriptional MocR family regulator
MAAKRLPSIRVMAHTLQVPKPTIGDAYDRLVAHARSLLHADPASTYRRAPLSLMDIGPRLDRAIDPLWIARQPLEASANMLPPRLRLDAARLDAQGRRAPRTAVTGARWIGPG